MEDAQNPQTPTPSTCTLELTPPLSIFHNKSWEVGGYDVGEGRGWRLTYEDCNIFRPILHMQEVTMQIVILVFKDVNSGDSESEAKTF